MNESDSLSARIAPVNAPASHRARTGQCGSGAPALNLARRHVAPASKALPAGAEQHLVFVSLGRGHVDLERGGESIRCPLTPGCVAVYPAGLPLRWSWRTPLSYCVLAIDPAFLDGVACRVYGANPGDFELLPAERSHDFDIAALVGTLTRETQATGPDSALYVESLANILAAHLLRHYGRWIRGGPQDVRGEREPPMARDSGLPAVVRRAVRFIEEHHGRDIGLRDIADAANVSPHHLAHSFKNSMGMPPHRYLMQVRVHNAYALLSIGAAKHSLAEVADATGFADQSHLTRHFKRALGMTPGQLKASARGMHGARRPAHPARLSADDIGRRAAAGLPMRGARNR
jgi:AraC family transcriptional regulator